MAETKTEILKQYRKIVLTDLTIAALLLALCFACFFCISTIQAASPSITIRHASGKIIGYVDGERVKNDSGKTIGYVRGGKTYNANGHYVASPEVPGLLFCEKFQ